MHSKETNKLIGELQFLEQHLQGFLAQKQIIQVELQEILNALEELIKSKDEIYRVLSGIMLKADKDLLIKELEEKKRLLQLRINSIEKHEREIDERSGKLKEIIQGAIGKEI